MDKNKPIACLFDLDGVIIDTESQYTVFWGGICKEFLGDESLCLKIKGKTLGGIYSTFFAGKEREQAEITARLNVFESQMAMDYIAGAKAFLTELKNAGVKTCLVTSSDKSKMASVYKNHGEFTDLFSHILTAEDFPHGKPAPDPYLLGAKVCGTVAENCFVFEDSFNGLQSGRSAGATVVGLATTNARDAIFPFADIVVDDFSAVSWATLQSQLK